MTPSKSSDEFAKSIQHLQGPGSVPHVAGRRRLCISHQQLEYKLDTSFGCVFAEIIGNPAMHMSTSDPEQYLVEQKAGASEITPLRNDPRRSHHNYPIDIVR